MSSPTEALRAGLLPGGRSPGGRTGRAAVARRAGRDLARLPLPSKVGAAVLLVYLLVAIAGPFVTPYAPDTLLVGPPLAGPSAAHWLGTDEYGRDVLSRLLAGEQQILLLALAATAVAIVVGSAIGLYSGYRGGRVDGWLMRAIDLLNSIPPLIAALVVLSGLGASSLTLLLTIGIVYAPRVTRVVRSVTLDVCATEYVASARARGEGTISIIRHEVLRNVAGVLLVEAGMRFAFTLTIIAALAVLGFGASPPNPSWGLSISDGRTYLASAPWITLAPAVAIAVLVIAVNLVTDGIARLSLDRASIGQVEGAAT
ncbi:MAG TPA: ABC transporter permease [Acidimicrobiales bacterium]|nr:ABC transporter permease [Acidimicrobiales bacterium]